VRTPQLLQQAIDIVHIEVADEIYYLFFIYLLFVSDHEDP